MNPKNNSLKNFGNKKPQGSNHNDDFHKVIFSSYNKMSILMCQKKHSLKHYGNKIPSTRF